MLVILLILFFTILLLYQLYFYLYPIKEGLDDSTCLNQQLSDFDKRITSLESKIDGFKLDEIEQTIVDLCNNVYTLQQQSDAQYADLQSQGNDASNMTTDQPSDITTSPDITQ